MAKKLAGIGAEMIGGRPALNKETTQAVPAPERAKGVTQYGVNLNFRVPAEFRRRFRGYAASHDLKLNEVLIRAFEALVHTAP